MAEQKDDISLRLGYWLAVHRDQLRTWWAIAILVCDALLLVYFFVVFATYSFGMTKTVQGIGAMAQPLVSPALKKIIAPVNLVTGTAVVLNRGNGRYDFVAPVTNSNEHWAAVQVRYHFTYGETTRDDITTLWPGSESFLTQANVALKVPETGATPSVTIIDVQWQRPDDLQRYTSDVSFPVSNVSIRPITGLASDVTATRLTATVQNKSVYSFRSVRFGVILKAEGAVVAVSDVIVERFKPLEERTIEVSWLSTLPTSSEATIFPILDLTDKDSYL
ncbi:MAG: hypothetical protein V1907_02455 [Candidatus Kerfeldbacteria bacterium]